MTTLLVNINDEQEERALLAFLDSHKYNYSADIQSSELSDVQKEEILRRERDFESGKIKAESWDEVKKRFIH
jgi:putative addiction module component (TIGR02574 family)